MLAGIKHSWKKKRLNWIENDHKLFACLKASERSLAFCLEGSRPRANQGWQDDHCASEEYCVP